MTTNERIHADNHGTATECHKLVGRQVRWAELLPNPGLRHGDMQRVLQGEYIKGLGVRREYTDMQVLEQRVSKKICLLSSSVR